MTRPVAFFVDHIAGVYEDKLMSELRDATFFSLTMDGTTDISAKEQESLYVRFSSAGAVQNKFLRFVEPEKHCCEWLVQSSGSK